MSQIPATASEIRPLRSMPPKFQDQIECWRPELIAQAAAILGNPEDAEDVVQETFCEAVHNADKLKEAQSPEAWLRAVNRCNALNKARGRKRELLRQERRQELLPERTFTTGGFSMVELRDAIAQALGGLPLDFRTVIRLRYLEQKTTAQIAAEMHLSVKAVGRLLLDASAQLYIKLERQLDTSTNTNSGSDGSISSMQDKPDLDDSAPTSQR